MNALRAMYAEQGFAILPNFVSPDQITAMKQRAEELVDTFDPYHVQRSVFTTERDRHVDDAYFLSSGDKIRFFFEENVFDKKGELLCEKRHAINKIGHALHALDPVFAPFSSSPEVAELARMLGYVRPMVVQSMYIFKQPGVGGAVNPHQDTTFLYTDPPSCCGLWIALEDATLSNGCLWAIPGSHRTQAVPTRFVRTSIDDYDAGVQFLPLSSPDQEVIANSYFVPLEVPAGTCIVLHGATVHKSEANRSPISRHAYSLHFIEQYETQYLQDNWLQPTDKNTFVEL